MFNTPTQNFNAFDISLDVSQLGAISICNLIA
jgi:hypothetical protein